MNQQEAVNHDCKRSLTVSQGQRSVTKYRKRHRPTELCMWHLTEWCLEWKGLKLNMMTCIGAVCTAIFFIQCQPHGVRSTTPNNKAEIIWWVTVFSRLQADSFALKLNNADRLWWRLHDISEWFPWSYNFDIILFTRLVLWITDVNIMMFEQIETLYKDLFVLWKQTSWIASGFTTWFLCPCYCVHKWMWL